MTAGPKKLLDRVRDVIAKQIRSRLFEIASVLVRVNHVASLIVYANVRWLHRWLDAFICSEKSSWRGNPCHRLHY